MTLSVPIQASGLNQTDHQGFVRFKSKRYRTLSGHTLLSLKAQRSAVLTQMRKLHFFHRTLCKLGSIGRYEAQPLIDQSINGDTAFH